MPVCLVEPLDAHVRRIEELANLVAHQVRQYAWKSSEPATPCWTLLMIASSFARCSSIALDAESSDGALGHLGFEALRPLRIVECHRSLRRQHAQEVAVGVVKAPEGAVDSAYRYPSKRCCAISGATMLER